MAYLKELLPWKHEDLPEFKSQTPILGGGGQVNGHRFGSKSMKSSSVSNPVFKSKGKGDGGNHRASTSTFTRTS